ncbi:glycosyltransferase [Baekduia sp. Peel2402]|uniref:glycosyltransferase n=1 Tax=Baekduia sp. Peel2402 TaxID=3458296 RepID=UPI00403EA810
MLVGVDARALAARRGVARFTRRMVEALAALDGVGVRALVPGREPVESVEGVEIVRTRAPSRVVHLAGAVAGFPRVDTLLGDDVDVVWLPAPAPVAAGDPYVLTVHDLSWEDRPQDFTRYERLWHRAARPAAIARGARAVVCDAPSVAEQVRARWGVNAWVVEPGIDAPPEEAATARGGEYFLYVGALEPRKGLDVLAAAWARAGLARDGVELLVAGEGREPVPGATLLGHVSDAELHSLYAGARAIVLPSLLEGFGLTPREAAAHGTPSIVSDLPTLRLPGTLRVPPGDSGALAEALQALDAPERARLVSEIPPTRTWAEAATELRAVLEGAAGP